MAQGVICEQGIPQQIFEAPKNETTKEFLGRLQAQPSFSFTPV